MIMKANMRARDRAESPAALQRSGRQAAISGDVRGNADSSLPTQSPRVSDWPALTRVDLVEL